MNKEEFLISMTLYKLDKLITIPDGFICINAIIKKTKKREYYICKNDKKYCNINYMFGYDCWIRRDNINELKKKLYNKINKMNNEEFIKFIGDTN